MTSTIITMGPLPPPPPTTSLATLQVETMVAQTDDGRLGDDSPVVTTMVGTEEFLEEVTTFVSIAVWDTVWHS
jgi:hypothetical protein